MSGKTLIDTDILIDTAMAVPEAIACLERLENDSTLSISIITKMEIIVGCRNKIELKNSEHFLKRFEIVLLDGIISEQALKLLQGYRLSHGLAIPDALIAATALVLNHHFITKNQRDYRFIKGLKLLPYPS